VTLFKSPVCPGASLSKTIIFISRKAKIGGGVDCVIVLAQIYVLAASVIIGVRRNGRLEGAIAPRRYCRLAPVASYARVRYCSELDLVVFVLQKQEAANRSGGVPNSTLPQIRSRSEVTNLFFKMNDRSSKSYASLMARMTAPTATTISFWR